MPRKAELFKHEQNYAGHKNILVRRKCESREIGKKRKEKKKKKNKTQKTPTHKNTIYREWGEKGSNNLVATKLRHGDCV